MKKRVMAMLLLCVMAFSLVACGGSSGGSAFAGEWKIESMEAEGMKIEKDMLSMMGMDDITMKITEDGKVTMNMLGEEETIQGKVDGNKLVLEQDGEVVNLVLNGGKLVWDMGEEGNMTFSK